MLPYGQRKIDRPGARPMAVSASACAPSTGACVCARMASGESSQSFADGAHARTHVRVPALDG